MFTGTLPPVSHHADWPDSHAFELYDDQTDATIDLTTASDITLTIHDPLTCCDVLKASLSDSGITLQGTQTFIPSTWTADKMAALCPRTYGIHCEAVIDGKTIEVFDGSLPVI